MCSWASRSWQRKIRLAHASSGTGRCSIASTTNERPTTQTCGMASSTLTPYKRLAAFLPQAVPASDVQPEALTNSQDHSEVRTMDILAQSGMTSSAGLIKDWPIFCRKHYQHANLIENLWHDKHHTSSYQGLAILLPQALPTCVPRPEVWHDKQFSPYRGLAILLPQPLSTCRP